MIFESGVWSSSDQKWYFLPRRASREMYDETLDEKRGSNLIVISDDNFVDIKFNTIGEINPVRGYSSFKFVPNTNDKIVIALKSEEDDGKTKTYVTVFDISGFILIKDILISSKYKFEGIEFI
jgi:soluble calcium-activated nucleotidase 1